MTRRGMTKKVAMEMIAAKQLWRKACAHDGINPSASFVVLSDDNPFLPEYYQHMEVVMSFYSRP